MRPLPHSGPRAGACRGHGTSAETHVQFAKASLLTLPVKPWPPAAERASRAGASLRLPDLHPAAPHRGQVEAQALPSPQSPFPVPGRGPDRSGFMGLLPNTWTFHQGPLLSQPAAPGPPKGNRLPGPGSVADFRSSASLLPRRRKARERRAPCSPIGPSRLRAEGRPDLGSRGCIRIHGQFTEAPFCPSRRAPAPRKAAAFPGRGLSRTFAPAPRCSPEGGERGRAGHAARQLAPSRLRAEGRPDLGSRGCIRIHGQFTEAPFCPSRQAPAPRKAAAFPGRDLPWPFAAMPRTPVAGVSKNAQESPPPECPALRPGPQGRSRSPAPLRSCPKQGVPPACQGMVPLAGEGTEVPCPQHDCTGSRCPESGMDPGARQS